MLFALFSIALSLLVILLINFLYQYYRDKQILRKIPAPPGRFFFGHLYIITQTEQLFSSIRKFSKKYYPIYRFSTPWANVVHLLEPDDIELVLSSTKHLSKSRIYKFLWNWLGTGLLTSTGTKWHKRRKILTPAFHFTILQQFIHIFNEETEKLVSELNKTLRESTNIIPAVTNFTLQSIAETAMGLSCVEKEVQTTYKNAVYEIGRIILKRLEKPYYFVNSIYCWSKLAKEETAVIKILHEFSNSIIKKREKDRDGTNCSMKKRLAMLDLLLSAKKNGADIDYDGIREEVDTFMFEGHDTTSMAISFLLLALANLPEIQEKILEEILTVLGTNQPTFENLQELRYTESCIKEALRLFPSVPFISRFAGETFTTKTGYTIPKGTILHVHIFDVHRSEQIYPDPLKFDPDRFLPENSQKRHSFAYIPFSAGPRNCIGQRFALMELKVALCGVLRQFRLEKIDDLNGIEFKEDLILRPKKEVRIKIMPRKLVN